MLKAFTAIPIDRAVLSAFKSDDFAEFVESNLVEDPSPFSWATVGFAPVPEFNEGHIHRDEQGNIVFMVEIRERLLPSKVINAEVAARLAELEVRSERKATKQEKAQVKSEVVEELLPTTLIKPRNVLCAVRGKFLYVGVPSAKTVDLIVALLHEGMDYCDHIIENNAPRFPQWRCHADKFLTECALGNMQGLGLTVDDKMILKKDNHKITLDGAELPEDTLNAYIVDTYHVNQLALHYDQGLSFTLSEQMVFRKIKLDGIHTKDIANDAAVAEAQDGDAAAAAATFAGTTIILMATLSDLCNDLFNTIELRKDDEPVENFDENPIVENNPFTEALESIEVDADQVFTGIRDAGGRFVHDPEDDEL